MSFQPPALQRQNATAAPPSTGSFNISLGAPAKSAGFRTSTSLSGFGTAKPATSAAGGFGSGTTKPSTSFGGGSKSFGFGSKTTGFGAASGGFGAKPAGTGFGFGSSTAQQQPQAQVPVQLNHEIESISRELDRLRKEYLECRYTKFKVCYTHVARKCRPSDLSQTVFYNRAQPGVQYQKPDNFTLEDWEKAVKLNPDDRNLIPVQTNFFQGLSQRAEAQVSIRRDMHTSSAVSPRALAIGLASMTIFPEAAETGQRRRQKTKRQQRTGRQDTAETL